MSEQDQDKLEAAKIECRKFDLDLPAYLEGEDKPLVASHAQHCPFCSAVLADLEQIRSLSRQMDLQEPPARVWANIRATLAAEGVFRDTVRGWQRWLPQLGFLPNPVPVGALACLAIFGAALLAPPSALEQKETSPWLSSSKSATVATPSDSGEDRELARTVRELENSYQAREMLFEPAVKATYQRSLESLDTSIRECLDSVRQEPANTLAREYLLTAYTQKAEVLASALAFDTR